MRFALMILFLIGSVAVKAQPRLKLTEKHINRVNKEKDVGSKLTLYRKYFKKDSLRYIKKTEHYWQAKTDSLTNAMVARQKAVERKSQKLKDGVNSKIYNSVYRPWARRQAAQYLLFLDRSGFLYTPSFKIILRNYWENYFLEATQDDAKLLALQQRQPDLQIPKSLASCLATYKALGGDQEANLAQSANQKLNGLRGNGRADAWKEKAQQASGEFNQYSQYGKALSGTDTVKGFARSEGEKLIKEQASKLEDLSGVNDLKGQLGEARTFTDQAEKYQGELSQMQDSTYLKEQAKKKAEEMAMKYVSEHPEVMRNVQRKMTLLMRKYSVVPNSNDLSTAVKRTSLKGKPLRERLYLAGNFQVVTLDPVSIDFSPAIGYRFNTRLIAGIGGTYRQTFSDTIPSLSPTVFGYKVFTSYDVLSNFFVYSEFDRNCPGVKRSEGNVKRIWKNAAFVGIGRKFMIHTKVEMTLTILYDFLHEDHDPVHPRAWAIRAGFQTSPLAFFKK